MASNSDNRRTKRRLVVEVALIVVSLLLVVFGTIAVGPLAKVAEIDSLVVQLVGGVPLPKADPITSAARLGFLDAIFLGIGAVASLFYLSKRMPWLRNVALTVWLSAIVISIVLTIQGRHTLVANPARGDFAGLVNLGMLVVHVIIPCITCIMTGIAVVCLIFVNPRHG
jgi:hypothetical protein